MNQINQYIFNLYHFMLQVRDTMEFTIDREHQLSLYQSRKKILTDGIKPGFAFGNFLENNQEKGEELKKKFVSFIDEVYGNNSTILRVSGDKLIVDYSQNIRLLSLTEELSETLREIVISYINLSRKNEQQDSRIINLMSYEEKLYRLVFTMLCLKEYQSSFGNFQKVMSESQGKPTPQSNYIVNNELNVIAGMIRNNYAHDRDMINENRDVVFDAIKYVEMAEGRRERLDNKPFGELYKATYDAISSKIPSIENQWKELFQELINEMLEIEKTKNAELN